MTNYANWYAYYRTRILAAKTTTAIAFNIVDNKYRVGFHCDLPTRRAPTGSTRGDFVPAPGCSARTGTTSCSRFRSAPAARRRRSMRLIRIGELVENGAGAVAGPARAHRSDPDDRRQSVIVHEQLSHPVHRRRHRPARAAHGGRRSGRRHRARAPVVGGPRTAGRSGAAEPTHGRVGPQCAGRSPGRGRSATPRPPRANSLADISLYYWMRDLRRRMPTTYRRSDGRASKDLDWKSDPAWWQHVNFSALSYRRRRPARLPPTSAVEDRQIAAGAAAGSRRPITRRRRTTRRSGPAANRPATAIDDLWHAAVNGRGKFVFAETPIEVAYGLGSIISGIGNNRRPASARPSPASRTWARQQLHLRGDDRARLVRRAEEGDDRHDHRRAGRDALVRRRQAGRAARHAGRWARRRWSNSTTRGS